MVPKWDQGKRYASKWRIPLYCLVATKQEKKPATGQVMVQARGQELRRITEWLWRLLYDPFTHLWLMSSWGVEPGFG